MSFRQNNEYIRRWNTFYQANRELIEDIGLPGPTVDTWDRFADLLMHGIIDHHSDPTYFNIDELSPDKVKLFRILVDRYFEAGFSDPGMHPALIGYKDYVKLVRKYPKAFGEVTRKFVEEDLYAPSEEWWLDSSALPDLLWARLSVYLDGSAEVLDLDGTLHEFSSREEAVDWLGEDEYSSLEDLIQEGLLQAATRPPSAASDGELVPKMLVHSDTNQ